jgi:diaminopropionate ammonia-lyase
LDNQHYYINNPSCNLPINKTHEILSNSEPLLFHQSLSVYEPSPLVNLNEFADEMGVKEIWMKDESSRFGLNAFKVLGASYAVNELLKSNPDVNTFCTATDGNHGKAIAWSALLHHKNAVVYMPKNSSINRVKAIEDLGAKVIVTDVDYDSTCEMAANDATKNGWQLVQDTAWEGYEEIAAHIMAGYLTHFMEMENSLHSENQAKVDFVFLQAGVGTWAGAAVWYYLNRYFKNKPTLIIVEPVESDGILESFKNGERRFPKGSLDTIMAGLNCGIPSLTGWEIIENGANAAMRISDKSVEKAMKFLYKTGEKSDRIIAGESGAAGFAGFVEIMTNPIYYDLKTALNINEHSRILCYNTEGDTDPDGFQKIVSMSF